MKKPRLDLEPDDRPEPPIVPPPAAFTVDMERKPVLFLPDGKVLVRRIGF